MKSFLRNVNVRKEIQKFPVVISNIRVQIDLSDEDAQQI